MITTTLIGVHGAIKHGKTTLAEAFELAEPNSLHLESGEVIGEVLTPLNSNMLNQAHLGELEYLNSWLSGLPSVMKRVLDIEVDISELQIIEQQLDFDPDTYEKLFQYTNELRSRPEMTTEPITADNKPFFRPGLQGLGNLLVKKVSKTIWYDELLRRVNYPSNIDKELFVIGGLRYPADANVLKKAGGIILEIVRPDAPTPDSSDPTERYRRLIQSNSTVYNDGLVDQLVPLAKGILDDIERGNLHFHYKASNY